MKVLYKKTICLLLTSIMSFSFVGCVDGGTSTNGNFPKYQAIEGLSVNKNPNEFTEINYVWKNDNEKELVSQTDTYLYENGTTDYSIVISRSEKSALTEQYAAQELQYFLKDATGVHFPIVYDYTIEGLDETAKYISIGNTTIYKDSPMYGTLDVGILGNDGFKIQTYGNTVVINACGNNGIVYGVYGFLERNMDYHYYAQDTWTICTESQRKLMKMDVCDIPTFASRYLNRDTWEGRKTLESNLVYMTRLRHHGSQGQTFTNGTEGGGWWGSDQSLCQQLLRVETYINEHPSGYFGGGLSGSGQLCFSTILANQEDNGVKPLDELYRNLVDYIVANPGVRVFLLGINDNNNGCDCNRCAEQVKDIKYSGQMCLLANELSRRLEVWQSELPENDVNKDRQIILSFFGYKIMMDAPTVYNEETNTHTLIKYDYDGDGDDSDLELRDNINVRVTPIGSYFTRNNFESTYNHAAYQSFMAWSTLTERLSVWDYATCFSDYLTPYPDWGVIQDNLLFYHYLGVTEMFSQLPTGSSGTSFYAMNLYLRAQLMWDINQNVEALIEDFFLHYYGPQAYDFMYSYYKYIRLYYQMMDYDYNGDLGYTNFNGVRLEYHGYIKGITSTSAYFPYNLVKRLEDFFVSAEKALDEAEPTEQCELYINHVHGESLFYRYLLLKNYQTKYSVEERAEMIDLFEKYAKIHDFRNNASGSGTTTTQVADMIAAWRKAL